jgi:peroxiredoxin
MSAPWWPARVSAQGDVFRRRVLRDQTSRKTSLAAEADGHALVVVVMKGHWSRVCIDQLQRLGQLRSRLAQLDSVLVGLNSDAPDLNRQMSNAQGIECKVLSDEKHEVISGLGLWLPREQHPLPAIVVFDRCGDEAARWVGRRPGDRPEADVLRLLQKVAEEDRVCAGPSAPDLERPNQGWFAGEQPSLQGPVSRY